MTETACQLLDSDYRNPKYLQDMATIRRKEVSGRKMAMLMGFNVITLIVVVVLYMEWSSTSTILSDASFSLPPLPAPTVASDATVVSTSLSLPPIPAFEDKPTNWTFRFNQEQFQCPENVDLTKPRIVFFHIQHHAGTLFYKAAIVNKECAPRACRQDDKQCLVSYSEQVEAKNIRDTRMTFIPYEIMLPPQFPLPFVNEREGFFFATIMRHPIDRLKTVLRRVPRKQEEFWYTGDIKRNDPYIMDNLSVRWLAGVTYNRQITDQDLHLAKCRLELLDLVITDKTHTESMIQVVCPLRGWRGCKKIFEEHDSKKSDSLSELDPVVAGAWIERQRPSFELYDYARRLSVHQLQTRHGIANPKDHLLKPSFVQTMEKYANITSPGSMKMKSEHVPVTGCEEYHRLWASNQDLVPRIWGLNTILKTPDRSTT